VFYYHKDNKHLGYLAKGTSITTYPVLVTKLHLAICLVSARGLICPTWLPAMRMFRICL